eukprot:2931519-Pyramimonas_sp.AAC.1
MPPSRLRRSFPSCACRPTNVTSEVRCRRGAWLKLSPSIPPSPPLNENTKEGEKKNEDEEGRGEEE